MPDEARNFTDKKLEQMEKHLNRIYSRAKKEIGETWKEYMTQAGKQLASLQDAYEKAKASGDQAEIKRAGKALGQAKREATIKNDHYKKMVEQVSEELSRVNERAAAYINDQLPKIYEVNYNFTGKQIQLQTDNAISYELVNERTIKNLIDAGDKSLLPHYELDPKKDIPWNMRNINSEVLQGILQGESMQKISERLIKVENLNGQSAIRAARTIVTTTENKARYDNAQATANKGVIMKKEWIATGDKRTRDAHMDAWSKYGTRDKAIPMDEYFTVGKDEMLFAGDSSNGSPENVYNCRCSTPYFPAGFTSILPPEMRGKIKVRFSE